MQYLQNFARVNLRSLKMTLTFSKIAREVNSEDVQTSVSRVTLSL